MESHAQIVEQLSRLGAAGHDAAVEARLLDLIVDATGVALAGGRTRVGGQAEGLFGSSAHPWDAALVLGTRMHALDFDDTHEPSLCHTAAALLPALLALGFDRHVTGASLLRAYELGLGTTAFLSPCGTAINAAGGHSTGIVGGLASAAACAWLLTEDAERAADAVEIASLLVSGLGLAFGTDCKPVQAGHAAEVGVRAALLAEARVSCPRSGPFGPRGLFGLWLGPGAPEPRWGTDGTGAAFDVAVKPYPSCFLTHGSIDAMLELRPQLGGAEAIERVELTVSPMANELANKTALASPNDAKFSLRYCALAALTEGRVTLDTFAPAARQRLAGRPEEWERWCSRFEVRAESRVPVVGCDLRIHTADGRTLHATTTAQRGSPGRPLSRQEIVDKFVANAAPAIGERAAARLLGALWALPETSSIARSEEIGSACGTGPLWSRATSLAPVGA